MGDKTGAFADHLSSGTGPRFFNEAGLRNVGSYQVSGHPFITGSGGSDYGLAEDKVHMVEFPFVCKSFTVINDNATSGHEIRVHFQSGSGVTAVVIRGHHYVTVPAGFASVTFDVKCKKFYISQGSVDANLTYQVMADLTNISTNRMYHLTGSGITECEDTH